MPLVVAKAVPLVVWAPGLMAKLPVGPVAAPSCEVAARAGCVRPGRTALVAAAHGVQCTQLTRGMEQQHTDQHAAPHAVALGGGSSGRPPHCWLE